MSKAVLLVNLGSPDSPSVADVRRYLREFLMDGRVLDVAWPIRFAIVHFAILPSRPKESSHAYQSIWTPQGSPLVVTSQRVRDHLVQMTSLPVALAMRYQNPTIQAAIKELAGQGVSELLLIPLFPHYAMSSYETAVVRVQEVARKISTSMKVVVQPPYFDHPDYIAALAESARPYIGDAFDYLLFSYHGVPERQIKKSDPTGCHCLRPNCCDTPSAAHEFCYRAQCYKTTAAFASRIGLPKDKYSVSFQSRLGRDPWLSPYTDKELERLAMSGVRNLLVMCPAFVSDCLETIEEIGMRGKEIFLNAGGTRFTLIPCLNEHPLWLEALRKMADRFAGATQLKNLYGSQVATVEGATRLE